MGPAKDHVSQCVAPCRFYILDAVYEKIQLRTPNIFVFQQQGRWWRHVIWKVFQLLSAQDRQRFAESVYSERGSNSSQQWTKPYLYRLQHSEWITWSKTMHRHQRGGTWVCARWSAHTSCDGHVVHRVHSAQNVNRSPQNSASRNFLNSARPATSAASRSKLSDQLSTRRAEHQLGMMQARTSHNAILWSP